MDCSDGYIIAHCRAGDLPFFFSLFAGLVEFPVLSKIPNGSDVTVSRTLLFPAELGTVLQDTSFKSQVKRRRVG